MGAVTITIKRPMTTVHSKSFGLYPRADSSTDSASSSKTSSKESSTKCTSKAECKKPSDATDATTVAVAVVVPVAVVGLILCFVLWKVWKRSKKEAMEDNDPDFDGDGEYLPQAQYRFDTKEQSEPTSGSNFDDYELKSQRDPFAGGYAAAGPHRQHFPLDPFQLPASDDTDDLRTFARSVQNNEFDGYRLASRNASELSLSRTTSALQKPQGFTQQGRIASFTSSNLPSRESMTNLDMNRKEQVKQENPRSAEEATIESYNSEEFPSEVEDSPIKSARVNVEQGYVSDAAGLDPENSYRNGDGNADDVESNNNDFVDAKFDTDVVPHGPSGAEDDYELENSKEEENIKRMKSIYEVYLDRNGTVRTVKPSPNGAEAENTGFQESYVPESLPVGASSQIEKATAQQQYAEGHQTETQPEGLNVPGQLAPETVGTRAASSIYSEMPTMPQQTAQGVINRRQAPYGQELPNSYTPQYYNDPNAAYYGQGHAYMLQQYHHPQALEHIEELPNPSNIPFSTSASSLTSYNKKAGKSMSPGGIRTHSGTTLNPLDHPELFYSQTSLVDNNELAYDQQAKGPSKVLPHHLRQSVVMTDPAQLSHSTLFKPAGSFRNMSAANSRNNSMTSQHTIQQYQTQMALQRVSGILDEHDTVQPPRLGGILPHNGSQDDLRRQLGSSDNYNVS